MNKMRERANRAIACIMSVVMAVGLMPLPAFATTGGSTGLAAGVSALSADAGAEADAGSAQEPDAQPSSSPTSIQPLSGGLTALAGDDDYVIVGTGTNSTYSVPFCTYYNNGASEIIYKASDIDAAGKIKSIAFQNGSSNTYQYAEWLRIYMGHTSLTTFSSSSYSINTGDLIDEDDLTEVYFGENLTLGGSADWDPIVLDTPFDYNGEDNLVVAIVRCGSNYDDNFVQRYTYASGSTYPVWSCQNDKNQDTFKAGLKSIISSSSLNKGVANTVPNIRLEIASGAPEISGVSEDVVAKTGTSVDVSVTATAPEGKGTTEGLTYQWYAKDDDAADGKKAVEGGTSATLTITGEAVGETEYFCEVTNTWTEDGKEQTASSTSGVVKVSFYDVEAAEPTATVSSETSDGKTGGIVNQPNTITLTGAGTVEGDSGVNNPANLTYQWYVCDTRDGDYAKIDGETGTTYSPSTAELSDKYYKFEVTNHYYGTATSKMSEPYRVQVKGTEIDSAAALVAFAQSVNSGTTYEGRTIELTADIDLSKAGDGYGPGAWTPIGSGSYSYSYYSGNTFSGKPFKGIFEGHNKTISGLNASGSGAVLGLFGYVQSSSSASAEIRNLAVEGTVDANSEFAAGVVAKAEGTASYPVKLTNVGSDVTVKNAYTGSNVSTPYTGGVVGDAICGAFSGCYNKGDVESTKSDVGGIVGHAQPVGYGNGSVSAKSCYNTATVKSTVNSNTKDKYVGGIVGGFSNGNPTVENCVNTGAIDIDKGSEYSVPTVYGAISGVSTSGTASNFYLSTSCDYGENATVVEKDVALSASQISGSAVYPDDSETHLLDALNAEPFANTWISGMALGQDCPMLSWEYVPGTPKITTQPAGATYKHDETQAALTIAAELPDEAKDSGVLSYQWYQASSAGASPDSDEKLGTATSQAISVAAGEDAYFYCVVTDAFDGDEISVVSDVVRVKVFNSTEPAAVSFTTQPKDTPAEQCATATLTAQAGYGDATEGAGDVTCQWYRCDDATGANPVAIAGATDWSFNADTAEPGEAFYFCRATNTFDERTATADSNVVKVTVTAPTISTAAELKAFADNVNENGMTYEGVTVTLLEDIDLSVSTDDYAAGDWTPIGGSSKTQRFKGMFDGDGHTISGLSVKDASGEGYRGLFGYITSTSTFTAGVKNLVVKGSVTGAGSYVGGVVGWAMGDTDHPVLIENVGSEAEVKTATTGYSNCVGTGGVLGYACYGVKVVGCYNKGPVTGDGSYVKNVGGIVGQNGNSANLEITSCYNLGTVDCGEAGASCSVGGIVGQPYDYLAYLKVTNCVNAGDVIMPSGAYYYGAISGCQSSTVPSSDADANYWLDSTSSRSGGYNLNDHNIAVTADQLAGLAAYPADSDTTLLDALNNGNYVGTWIDGGLTADEQACPALAREEVAGKPSVSIAAAAERGKIKTGDAPDEGVELTAMAALPAEGTGSDGTLKYQWYIQVGDGEPSAIEGAMAATFKAQRDEIGKVAYFCKVTNEVGGKAIASRTSKTVAIDFYDFDTSVPNVAASSSAEGTVEQMTRVTLSSDVTWADDAKGKYAEPELAYQWFSRTGEDEFAEIEGATDADYEFDALTLGQVDYKVAVTNTYCGTSETAESDVVSVTAETIKIGSDDEAKLRAIAENVNKDSKDERVTYEGATIELTGDLALTSDWTPIGDNYNYASKSFRGAFDGHDHTISGLKVTDSSSCGALFGFVMGGTVKNLTVAGTVSGKSSSGTYYAGVVAYASSGTTIENVVNQVAVTGGQYAGGIVGSAASGKVSVISCYNDKAVESTFTGSSYSTASVGGLVGYSNGTTTIKGSYNRGAVKCAGGYIGGLVGQDGSNGGTAIERSYNAGAVDGTNASTSRTWNSSTYNYDDVPNCGGIWGSRSYSSTIDGASAWLLSDATGAPTKASGYQNYGDNLPNGSTEAQMKSKALVKALNAGEDGENLGLFKVDTGSVNGGFPTVYYQGGSDVIDFSPAVAVVKGKLEYTGSALELPSSLVDVTFDGEKIDESLYELSAEDDVVDAGFYDATVSAVDNGPDLNNLYVGATAVVIEVLGQSISAKASDASVEKQTYTGKEVEPSVEIDGLTEGIDYEVAYYSDNVEVGTATATVAGMGNYRGTLDVPFEIGKVDISTCDVTVDDQRFTGQQVKPSATVTNGDVELVAGRDYQVVYPKSGNTDIGYGTVTIAGRGVYEGTAKCRFNIVGGDLSESGWIIKPFTEAVDYSDYYYGATPAPTVVSSDDESIVLSSSYYTTSYANNKASGTATVKVTGKNGFTGELTATFEARYAYDRVNLADYEATAESVEFTGKVAKPTVAVKAKEGDGALVAGVDYTVEVPDDAILPGTYTATVTGTGNSYGGVTGAIEAEFTIMGEVDLGEWAEISELPDVYYSGKAFEPEIAVTVPGKTLVRGTDYELVFADNVKPGTASVLAVGLTDEFTGVATATFEIKATTFARAGVEKPEIAAQAYTGKAIEPAITLKTSEGVELVAGVDYLVTYSSNVNAGTGRALIVGWGGYLGSKTIFATFDIAKADQTIALGKAAKSGKYAFNKTIAMDASVTKGTGAITYASSDESVATVDETGLVKVVKGSGKATITATAAGDANYNEASASIVVTATKAANTLTVKAAKNAKIKYGAKARTIAISKAYSITKAQGTKSFKKKSGNANITVNAKTGLITVKKGLKVGTYKIKVEVTAAGNGNYNKGVKTVETTVTVTK